MGLQPRGPHPARQPRPARDRRGRPVLARLDDRRVARRVAAAAARRPAAAAAGEPGHPPRAGRHVRPRLGHGRRRRHPARVRLLPRPHLAHASRRSPRRSRACRTAASSPRTRRPRCASSPASRPGLIPVPGASPRQRDAVARGGARSWSTSCAISSAARGPASEIDDDGETTSRLAPRPLEQRDIIVVTPYNAQQVAVEEALADAGFRDVPVGTVDRFQGQEAAVAIVSLAASSGRDAPRGLEFLLLRNRLNVAISRAMHTAYLISSPGLLDDLPRTPEGVVPAERIRATRGRGARACASRRPPAVRSRLARRLAAAMEEASMSDERHSSRSTCLPNSSRARTPTSQTSGTPRRCSSWTS